MYLNGGYSSRRRLRNGTIAGTAGLAAVLGFSTLQAQEVPVSASQVILDFGQRLEYSSNPDLDPNDEAEGQFISRTLLGLNYIRRTGTDTFSFEASGDLEIRDNSDDDDDSNTDIDNPFVGLDWDRETARARIGLSFFANEVDLGTTTGTFFNSDTGSVDFGTLDQGTRRTADITLDGEFGIDTPIGGSYELGAREIRYSDTEDPDLLDADRLTFAGDVFFAVNSRTRVGVEAAYIDFDETGEGEIDTVDTSAGVFAEIDFSQATTGRFALGWQEVEDTGAENNTEDGLTGSVALERELVRSTALFEALSEVTDDGQRYEASAGQRIPLTTGEFDYAIGFTHTEGLDTEPLFNIGWRQELARGILDVTLDQRSFSGRGTDETRINSRLDVTYEQQLTTRSSFDVGFAAISRNELGEDAEDGERFDFDITYRYALTPDWNLTSGVSIVRINEDNEEDTDDETIFIGLERRFVWN
ncbi:MAG: hypothetical protein AAGJ28_00170 [Pseudomonadota bacterium]